MALQSSTYCAMTQTDFSEYNQTVEIGSGRTLFVTAYKKSMKFAIEGKPDFVLYAKATKLFVKNLEEIRRATQSFKANELSEALFIPLGRRFFVSVSPDVKCVSFRRFFRPKHDTSIMLPGYQGFGMKFSEFDSFIEEFENLRKSLDLDDIQICEHDFSDTSCDYCYN